MGRGRELGSVRGVTHRTSNRTVAMGKVRTAGASGGRKVGRRVWEEREKIFPTVGNMSAYKGFYREGTVRRKEFRTASSIQDI